MILARTSMMTGARLRTSVTLNHQQSRRARAAMMAPRHPAMAEKPVAAKRTAAAAMLMLLITAWMAIQRVESQLQTLHATVKGQARAACAAVGCHHGHGPIPPPACNNVAAYADGAGETATEPLGPFRTAGKGAAIAKAFAKAARGAVDDTGAAILSVSFCRCASTCRPADVAALPTGSHPRPALVVLHDTAAASQAAKSPVVCTEIRAGQQERTKAAAGRAGVRGGRQKGSSASAGDAAARSLQGFQVPCQSLTTSMSPGHADL
jgi:hypothetical protein